MRRVTGLTVRYGQMLLRLGLPKRPLVVGDVWLAGKATQPLPASLTVTDAITRLLEECR